MKKILCLLLALIMPLILFSGCSNHGTETNDNPDRFKHICYSECCILIDKETRVMYMWRKENRSGGLTVMLNPDGTPMLWEGELEGENK